MIIVILLKNNIEVIITTRISNYMRNSGYDICNILNGVLFWGLRAVLYAIYLPKIQACIKHIKNANTSGYFARSVSWSSPKTDIVVFLIVFWNIESKNPLHALATDAAPIKKTIQFIKCAIIYTSLYIQVELKIELVFNRPPCTVFFSSFSLSFLFVIVDIVFCARFPDLLISLHGDHWQWLTRSCDSHSIFFRWGYVKSLIYVNKHHKIRVGYLSNDLLVRSKRTRTKCEICG